MIRMKNSQNVDRHKNIFSDAFNKQKEDTFYYLEDNIVGKEAIEEKLKEIHSNIEKIGKLCDRKKKTSYEEYNSVMNFNKNKLNEDLNKYKNKLLDLLKNSSREDDIRKLQEDFMTKKLKVFDSNKSLEKLNKILIEEESKLNSLKQDYIFLDKEISNSEEYNKYLKNKLKDLEEDQKFKQSAYLNVNNSSPSTFSLGLTNRQISVINKEKSSFGQSQEKRNSEQSISGTDDLNANKLRNYFNKNENMIKQKLYLEEKKQKEKEVNYNSLFNFRNNVQEIFREKVKSYENKQFNLMTEKVSNQEIFFNKSKDLKEATFNRSQINELKNKSLFSKLNNLDKKEIVKSFLEDYEIKKLIYSYLYD